jgi:hypothetical protein
MEIREDTLIAPNHSTDIIAADPGDVWIVIGKPSLRFKNNSLFNHNRAPTSIKYSFDDSFTTEIVALSCPTITVAGLLFIRTFPVGRRT